MPLTIVVPRTHPLTGKTSLAHQMKLLGLVCDFVTTFFDTAIHNTQVKMQNFTAIKEVLCNKKQSISQTHWSLPNILVIGPRNLTQFTRLLLARRRTWSEYMTNYLPSMKENWIQRFLATGLQ